MIENQYLTGHFLIAMPQLDDPNFEHSVIYICDHDADGAMGIVINKPLDVHLDELFDHFEIASSIPNIADIPVMMGGPVQNNHGFILHSGQNQWDSTRQIDDNTALTYSRDILEDIAHENGPDSSLIALGYSGWGGGQLETEILENAWLHTEADHSILFDTDYHLRWNKSVEKIGIDISTLSGDFGHA